VLGRLEGSIVDEGTQRTADLESDCGHYHRKLLRSIENDVVIVGAGPAGLTAAFHLAVRGRKVTARRSSSNESGRFIPLCG
jgi:NADPH-dependent 2,4-dienoyl-CoA reductase/sulfur reductase-like enzyme